VDLFLTTWQGFDIEGFEVLESVNGINIVTYNVQIPFKRQAIQVKLVGPADRKGKLRALLRQVLDGFNGESNWLPSALPPSVAGSENYGTVLLCLAISSVIAGLVVLWFVSRRPRKGTVLLIAAVSIL